MKIKLLIFLVLSIAETYAQSGIEKVLQEVSVNNKTLKASTQYWETQKIQNKIGLTLPDPTIEYDYMIGRPVGAGNQTDLTIAQTFDYPTVYKKKSELADKLSGKSTFEQDILRQNILLEAKKICIELVYRNKLNAYFSKIKNNTKKLLTDFQSKMDKGDGIILDVNKAKLQLVEVRKVLQENTSNSNQLSQKLIELNGGIEVVFNDSLYSITPNLPEFTELEQAYEATDPLLKSLVYENQITQKQLEVNKALWLPKFIVGYHYQGILGQNYNGFHTGISIPLWERRNTIKVQEQKKIYDESNLNNHRNEHFFQLKALYEKYNNLKISLAAYKEVFESLNNEALLDKSLKMGQITAIEYFLEMNYYNSALKNYLEVEKDLHLVVAELEKYKL